MKKTSLYISILICFSNFAQDKIELKTKFDDAIPVLNMGTFHMGYTNDSKRIDFDEHNLENIKQVHEIAKSIALFKPTVIIVEATPRYQAQLMELYLRYIENPEITFNYPNEIELLAYEVGRLSDCKRIYGIDYKKGYNYSIYYRLKNKVDSITYPKYFKMIDDNEKLLKNQTDSVLDILKKINDPYYFNYLLNINADILTYVSSIGKAQGAKQAAKFYHRNLVMFSNLNQIELSKDDRVFILMGAGHTAFFNDWLDRSPKYKLENVFDYLK